MINGLFKFPDDLSKLPVRKIKKSDDEYKSVLQKRIQRLNQWKPKAAESNLKNDFDKCVQLTKEGHELAEALKSLRNHFIHILPSDSHQALERVEALQEKSVQEDPQIKELLKYTDMQQAEARRQENTAKAKASLVDFIDGKGAKDESLLDFVEKRLANFDESRQGEIKLQVVLLFKGYQSYSSLVSVSASIIDMAELYRGLYYMGIVNIEGGRLDRKVLQDHIIAIVSEAVGLVPIVGEALSAFKISKEFWDAYREFKGVDVSPEIVKKAQFVEQFILNYETVLIEWNMKASALLSVSKNLEDTAKQYVI
jgi:hypothetical protein